MKKMASRKCVSPFGCSGQTVCPPPPTTCCCPHKAAGLIEKNVAPPIPDASTAPTDACTKNPFSLRKPVRAFVSDTTSRSTVQSALSHPPSRFLPRPDEPGIIGVPYSSCVAAAVGISGGGGGWDSWKLASLTDTCHDSQTFSQRGRDKHTGSSE